MVKAGKIALRIFDWFSGQFARAFSEMGCFISPKGNTCNFQLKMAGLDVPFGQIYTDRTHLNQGGEVIETIARALLKCVRKELDEKKGSEKMPKAKLSEQQ